MSDELVLYTNPMSRGRVARWMLEEVGAPYRTEIFAYGAAMKTPAYLAINPMGKVPAITHGGRVVTENAAICAYLADAFPEAGLAPPLAARDAYYRWLFFTAGPFEAAMTDRSLGVAVPAEREGMVGYGRPELVLDVIEAAIARSTYIASDRFSAADLYLAAYLDFQLRFKSIDERPVFRAYVDRMIARPAYLRATEIDGAMPG